MRECCEQTFWNSVNAELELSAYDTVAYSRSFLSQLAEIHVDPTVSDPKRIEKIPDDAISDGEGRTKWDRSDLETNGEWRGLWKDVGIFTDAQWDTIMAKCLTSMG